MIPFILGALAAVGISELSKKGKLPKMANGGGVKWVSSPKEYFDGKSYSSYSSAKRAIKNYEIKFKTKLEKAAINQLDDGVFEVII